MNSQENHVHKKHKYLRVLAHSNKLITFNHKNAASMAAIIAQLCLQPLRARYISLVVAALACTLYYCNIIWGRGFHLRAI